MHARDFEHHFNRALPQGKAEFQQIVKQFKEVARAAREDKLARKSGSSRPVKSRSQPSGSPERRRRRSSPSRQSSAESIQESSSQPTTAGRLGRLEPVEEAPKSATAYPERRQKLLKAMHQTIDLTNSGSIDAADLQLLEPMHQQLGSHKVGNLTREMHSKLLANIQSKFVVGAVGVSEFVQHVDTVLPTDPTEFHQIIKQFMEVAQAVREDRQLGTGSRKAVNRSRSAHRNHSSGSTSPRSRSSSPSHCSRSNSPSWRS